MAELLGVPYKYLVIIAIVPALFHYFACLTMVHLEAKRLKLEGVEPHLIPKLSRVIGESWHLVFPLIALVTMLLLDFTPFLVGVLGHRAVLRVLVHPADRAPVRLGTSCRARR